jgi:hypothetical protein
MTGNSPSAYSRYAVTRAVRIWSGGKAVALCNSSLSKLVLLQLASGKNTGRRGAKDEGGVVDACAGEVSVIDRCPSWAE